MFLGSALVTVIQLLFTARPTLFLPINSHSFKLSPSSFVHIFFCQCLCFYNEYGSVQWKTADDQDEQILNFPDMAIASTHQENKKEELFAS